MFTDLRIPAGRRPMTTTESWITATLSIAFTVMIALAVFEEFSIGRLSVVLFFVFWIPMLVLHELGHALAARLLGWKVREIVIGFGRTLWQGQIGETRIVIKLAPVEGYVLPAPIERSSLRLKSALIYAAGPGAELLFLAILIFIFGTDAFVSGSNELLHVCLQTLAFVVVLGAGFNLLPFRIGGAVSDGLGIISAPFLSEAAIDLRLMALDLRDVNNLLEAGQTSAALAAVQRLAEQRPGNPVIEQLLTTALAADGKDEAARTMIRAQLAESSLSDSDRRSWLALQARVELYAQSTDYLSLDLALQQALAITPDACDMLTIKGASLVNRKRHAEGGKLLADAWRRNDGSVNDAEILAWLALGAAGLGNADAAAYFAQQFSDINQSKWLASRLGARVERIG